VVAVATRKKEKKERRKHEEGLGAKERTIKPLFRLRDICHTEITTKDQDDKR